MTSPHTPRRLMALAGLLALAACDNDGGKNRQVRELNALQGPTRVAAVQFSEGTNMAAAPSPDGQRIAFTAQGALWVMPAAGGEARRITDWTIEPTAPVWAPDGSVIAFQNYSPEGNWHVWTVRPDGSDAKEVTTGIFDDREPAWTPDGRSLVFASDRGGDGQMKIWRYSLAEGRYTQLTQGPGAESNPAVSPDGSQLAFVDTNRIFVAPMAGGTPVQVAAGSMPAWPASGSQLIYQSTSRSLNAGGQDIVADEDLFPFPARLFGERLLYTADGHIRTRALAGGTATDIPFSATIHVKRPTWETRKDHKLDDFTPRQVKGISAPALSPDGRSVAFVALNDVWVMKIGEAPVRLTEDTDRDGNVQWTPDGAAVYFSTERGNAGALAVDRIEVASKARTRLAAIAAKSMVAPKMSPGGDRIAYTTLSGQLEVWDLGAGSSRVVTPSVAVQVSTPQWTANGTRILVVDNERINNRFREGYNKLRVIDAAGGEASFHAVAEAPRQVSDREEGAAALSPDGSKLAVIIDSRLHVMPMNPDGTPAGEAVAITDEAADLPSWAGDSQTLLYKAADKLRLVKADGSGAQDVAVPLQWAPKAPPATTIVQAGALWDGVSDSLRPAVDIVISGARITAIRPRQTPEPGATVIDATQLTVMPGLWDPHVHPLTLYQGGQFGQIAALMLSYGITSTLSVAGPLHQSIEMREALAAGNLIGPRLFACPPLWEGNRLFYSFARTLRTPEVADLEIAKAKAMDVDFLKSYVRAPIPIMQKIAQAGIDLGVPTGTHMLQPGAATGLAGTTHLSATQRMGYGWSKSINGLTYQDAVAMHSQADFHNIDTLFSSLALVGQDPGFVNDARFAALVPPNFVAGLTSTPDPLPATLETIDRDARQSGKVQDAGALLALGTDSPLVAPGIALHTNLRAGARVYSNVRALRNVTINAARMAFADEDLGTVEVGKIADLTIVRGDPLADVRNAAKVEYVVKNGLAYSLAQILAPFQTPQARAAHRQALLAYDRACRRDPQACVEGAHAD